MTHKRKVIDSQYIPSFCSSIANKPCVEGTKKDNAIKQSDPKIFNNEQIIRSIKCSECGKKQLVYVRANLVDKTIQKKQ